MESATATATANAPVKSPTPRPVVVAPLVDVFENDDEIVLVLNVPGVAPGDVDVKLQRTELVVTAKRGDDPKRARQYRRVFTVPTTIDAERVKAQLAHGVLTLNLAKRQEVKPRRIQVTGA